MSIRYLMVTVPFALGIACSHSSSSQAHTGAMWTTQSGDSSEGGVQVAQSGPQEDGQSARVTTTSGTLVAAGGQAQSGSGSMGSSSGSSDSGSAGSSGAMGSGQGSSGSSDTGSSSSGSPMGSGGSSESMGSSEAAQGGGAAAGSSAAAAGSHEMDKHVWGKVTQASKDQITISPKKGAPVTLQISGDTQVKMNGKSANASQIKPGQFVRASYQEEGSQEVAVTIDVGHARQGHHAKSRSQGGSTGSSGSSGSSSSGSGSSSK